MSATAGNADTTTRGAARPPRRRITRQIGYPTAAPTTPTLLELAEEDLLGFMAFPRDHWTKLRSTNPLERVNREIARRDVIGIYPNDQAVIRLASMLLLEQNDEWLVGRRYLSQESIAQIYSDDGRPCGPGDADPPALEGSAGRRRTTKEALPTT